MDVFAKVLKSTKACDWLLNALKNDPNEYLSKNLFNKRTWGRKLTFERRPNEPVSQVLVYIDDDNLYSYGMILSLNHPLDPIFESFCPREKKDQPMVSTFVLRDCQDRQTEHVTWTNIASDKALLVVQKWNSEYLSGTSQSHILDIDSFTGLPLQHRFSVLNEYKQKCPRCLKFTADICECQDDLNVEKICGDFNRISMVYGGPQKKSGVFVEVEYSFSIRLSDNSVIHTGTGHANSFHFAPEDKELDELKSLFTREIFKQKKNTASRVEADDFMHAFSSRNTDKICAFSSIFSTSTPITSADPKEHSDDPLLDEPSEKTKLQDTPPVQDIASPPDDKTDSDLVTSKTEPEPEITDHLRDTSLSRSSSYDEGAPSKFSPNYRDLPPPHQTTVPRNSESPSSAVSDDDSETKERTSSQRQASFLSHKTRTQNGISKKAPCKLCGKVYSASNMARHVRTTHYNERRFVCDMCNHGFKQQGHLQNHIRETHAKSELFTCSFCDTSFTRKHNLKRHMVHHIE